MATAAALGGGLALVAAGCGGGGPVEVTGAPTPTAEAATACRALLDALPDSLGDGLDRREARPADVFAAAYGSRPALLTCGATGVSPSYAPDATLSDVDCVGWFHEELDDDTVRFSTPTRTPQVVLMLPADADAFGALTAIAPAVRAHTTSTVEDPPCIG
ncbi:MAG: DUF3515 family protein [Frankia sp.]|nr:DUF3515 family protein [Frankia sp.]